MGNVLDEDSDDNAPEDARRRDPSKTISSLGWAEWKGVVSANMKALARELRDHSKADAENFECIEHQLEAGQARFGEIEKTLAKYGMAVALMLILIEVTLAAMGIAASAGWFSRGP